ncbi:MAG TPA: PaaI family thioesterase [Streptosporangiaceae bacterium]
MTFWQERLDRIQAGLQEKPAVVEILRLPDILSWEPGRVTTKWKMDSDFFAIGGQLFGGYLAALADQVLGHTAMTILQDDTWFRTVALSLTYYRAIRKGTIWINGRVAHASRHMIHIDVDFRDEDENLLCVARGVQSVIPMTVPAEN